MNIFEETPESDKSNLESYSELFLEWITGLQSIFKEKSEHDCVQLSEDLG